MRPAKTWMAGIWPAMTRRGSVSHSGPVRIEIGRLKCGAEEAPLQDRADLLHEVITDRMVLFAERDQLFHIDRQRVDWLYCASIPCPGPRRQQPRYTEHLAGAHR